MRHRRVILRGIEELVVIAEENFVRADGIRAPVDRSHLPVKFDEANVLRLLEFLVAHRRVRDALKLFVDRFLALLRIDSLLRLRGDLEHRGIERRFGASAETSSAI